MPQNLTWVIVGLSLIGTLLNVGRRWEGFLFWTVANVAWTVHNVLQQDWPQAALWAVYVLLALAGIFNWLRTSRSS